MKTLKITELGTPKDVQTKFGMKQKNSLKAEGEYGVNWLSFWCGTQTNGWKVGDTIEVEDVTTRDYQGKTYYDIKLPKVGFGGANNPKIDEILSKVVKIHLLVEELVADKRSKESTTSYPKNDLEEMPF